MTVHWSDKVRRFWIRDGDDVLWFDTEAEAEAEIRQQPVKQEIKLIVDYFRKIGKEQVARFIENGDYKNEN